MDNKYCPRPDFAREDWFSLNGEWDFEFEEDRKEELEGWIWKTQFSKKILVPFVYQTEKSGIHDSTIHEQVWYRRTFKVPDNMCGKRLFLKFGAVDYKAEVWLNGRFLGEHSGGYTPFEFEITPWMADENTVVLRVTDRPDTAQPRGKQYWKEKGDRCWYVASTGIWQNVWLEAVSGSPITHVKLTPDIDTNTVEAVITVDEYQPEDTMEIEVTYQGRGVKTMEVSLDGYRTRVVIALKPEDFIDELHYWTPEQPNLYDVSLRLVRGGKLQDYVNTYFGMRKISIEDGRIMLNHKPCYLKMVLDQGYWEESALTAPSDEALRQDILLTKELGFNGARKHQKIEDPRYYYWADKLGLLVWAEMPSGYEFCDREIGNLSREYVEFIMRDYNHPSIIAWVPLNESWGIRKVLVDPAQQNFAVSMYHLTKAMDPGRLVSTNDGWENVKTDIVGIHDYHKEGAGILKYAGTLSGNPESVFPESRRLFAYGTCCDKENSVFMVTEYGGIALCQDTGNGENWGYDRPERSPEDLLRRYRDVTGAIAGIRQISGFCYTQLTDVYQEVNGILNMKHQPKFPCSQMKEINDQIK